MRWSGGKDTSWLISGACSDTDYCRELLCWDKRCEGLGAGNESWTVIN